MKDPRFAFYKKHKVHPTGIINFFMIEGIKLQKKPSKYGLYRLTYNYVRNAYDLPNLKYSQLYYFLRRYKAFMKWLSKGKPLDIMK